MRMTNAAATVGVALLVVVGCKGAREPRVGETVTTGARILMNDDAAMMLTDARCRRESACAGGSGAGEGSLEACRRSLFGEMQAIVSTEACPAGVDEQSLTGCIAELRRVSCDDERRAIESRPGCSRFELCVPH